ncbi:hypothetical protein [Gimesia algae]|uniref:Tail assembly chaperone n=1 Tax=Gimesia algae TaxID=2527971 RepID=A0A517VMM4_9PLAN|nr:hypothetical protein [Gimesia algae]QDT94264.1 hypothetical protein Pan161_59590 [Gimesia algae]
MSSFTDTNGEKWTISVNFGTAHKLKQDLDIDLLSHLKDPKEAMLFMASLGDDPFQLGQIIYTLATPETEGLTIDGLFSALDSEKAEEAYQAFMDAVIDFFPPRLRAQLKKLFAKSMALQEERMEQMYQKVEADIDSPEMDERLRQQMAGRQSGVSSVSSASE